MFLLSKMEFSIRTDWNDDYVGSDLSSLLLWKTTNENAVYEFLCRIL